MIGGRIGAGLAVVVIVVGMLFFTAGTAFAHHADIAANISCAAKVDYTVTDWVTTGAGLANPDIAVDYNIGSGWVALPSGSFSVGHTAFSGSFTPNATPGTVVQIRATTAAAWDDGVAAGDSRSTSVTVPAPCVVVTTTTKPTTTTTTVVPTTTTKPPATTPTTTATTSTLRPQVTVLATTTTVAAVTTTTTALAFTGAQHVHLTVIVGVILILLGLASVIFITRHPRQ